MGLMTKYKCLICNKTVYYGINVKNPAGKVLYWLHPACAEQLKIRSNNTIPPYPSDPNEIIGIMNGTISRERHEYRKKCNVCGKVYCYSDEDIGKNLDAVMMAQRKAKNAVLNAIGGTDVGYYANLNGSERELSKIVDFTKCPYCNSSSLTDLTEEEFKTAVIEESQPKKEEKTTVEQMKEFKELLDLGIITQEEFDAKKKQLLGL